ncbi:hypothetical protein [Pseudomonas oryzae]|uniref:YXWGXW repeat-containing protein n=1 Tax=Pseudomonas oryzae TaxID=1392877 RepID=A0A1H1M2A5_9PSED|nr:hypothetical protein [Pseudomonas oryzae]SDR80944.1 hypothetical protein SAMN05216221_0382 [Pseudomonas oryzae]
MRRFAVGILLALILPLTACTVYDGDYGHGPYYGRPYPPPSHGDWRWDDDLRVYVNVGYPYIYYHDHVYYRWYDNRWTSGPGFRGPWRVIEHRHVPARLGQRYSPRPHYDYRRDHDRYDYRQPRYDNRDRHDDRDRYDYRDNRSPRDWQNRRDMERDYQQRRERRVEGYGQRFDEPQLRQLQQFRGRELERQPRSQPQRLQGIDRRQVERQWQQQRQEGRQVQGMPLNRQQQLQGHDRRHEQRPAYREHGQRGVGSPSRQVRGGREASGQEHGEGQGQGAGGPRWDNRR